LYAGDVSRRVIAVVAVVVLLAGVSTLAYAHHRSKPRHQCLFVIGHSTGVFVQSTHADCQSLARSYQEYAIRYVPGGKLPRHDIVVCRMSDGPDGDTGTIYDALDLGSMGALPVCEDLSRKHGWHRELGP
jgi:hypothetical protein